MSGNSISNSPNALMDADLERVAQKVSKRRKEENEKEIRREGDAIVLPVGMSLERGVELLNMQIKAAEQEYDIFEIVEGYPLDSAACFHRVLQNRYGFTLSTHHEIEDFFGGKKKIKPRIQQIKIGPKPTDIMQVPIGAFVLPEFDQQIITGFTPKNDSWVFYIKATLRAKDRDVIRAIVSETNKEVRTNSIYRGKALIFRTNEDGGASLGPEPEFMETDEIKIDDLILSKPIETRIEVELFSLIKHTKECIERGISLKQTVVLSGPPGTGKTLCARTAAKHCVNNKWTYIMVDKASGLSDALQFARKYEPALVFAEDVDRIASTRDDKTNKLMDELDGVLSKEAKVVTVLTTNNLQAIEKAVLRYGRADAIIPIEAPDAEAAERLVRKYAGPLLDKTAPLEHLCKVIAGCPAATIAGIVKRSMLGMICRGASVLSQQDLLVAAEGARAHIDLLADKKPPEYSDEEVLGRAFKKVVNGHDIPGQLTKIERGIGELLEHFL